MPTSPVRSRQPNVDEEIRHVRDLVFIRTALATRGATDVELSEYDAVIAAARSRLAETARLASAPYAAAA